MNNTEITIHENKRYSLILIFRMMPVNMDRAKADMINQVKPKCAEHETKSAQK